MAMQARPGPPGRRHCLPETNEKRQKKKELSTKGHEERRRATKALRLTATGCQGREGIIDFRLFHSGLIRTARRGRNLSETTPCAAWRETRSMSSIISVCQKTPLSELSCHDPPHFPRQLQPNFVQEDASDRSGWGDWWWTGPDLRDAAIGRRSRLLGSGFKG